jgi:hypothetical protein
VVFLRVDFFAGAATGFLADALTVVRVGFLVVARLVAFVATRLGGLVVVEGRVVVSDLAGVASGGSPRTRRLALLCSSSVRRNSWRPSGLATK